MNRRAFLRQLTLGTLSTPVLIQSLSNFLYSQPSLKNESILWIQGHESGIHQAALWSVPEFFPLLDKYFHILSWKSLNSDEDTLLSIQQSSKFILILEGFFPNSVEFENEFNLLEQYIKQSKTVILLGNEATQEFSSKKNNHLVLYDILNNSDVPYFILTGSPVQPRHLLTSLHYLYLQGPPELDAFNRPSMFYSKKICDHCEYRKDFDTGNYVKKWGEKKGCLFLLGCKGPYTYNDCPKQRWNDSNEWCVSVGGICTGCSELSYPEHYGLGMYGTISGENTSSAFVRNADSIGIGLVAATATGIALHAISKRTPSALEEEELDQFYGNDITK